MKPDQLKRPVSISVQLPEEVVRIAALAAARYSTIEVESAEAAFNAIKALPDLEPAVDEAEAAIKDLPNYDDFAASLVRKAIWALVHDVRHECTKALKKRLGLYGAPQKVSTMSEGVVSQIYQKVIDDAAKGQSEEA